MGHSRTLLPFAVVEGIEYPQVGRVVLEHVESGAVSTAPMVVDHSHLVRYDAQGLPAGAYRLSSELFYYGPDGQTRRYSLIETSGGPQSSIIVELNGGHQELDDLSLRLAEDVCAEPE